MGRLQPWRHAVVDASVVCPRIGANPFNVVPVNLRPGQWEPGLAVGLAVWRESSDGSETRTALRQRRGWSEKGLQALRQRRPRLNGTPAHLRVFAARGWNGHRTQVH